MTRETARFAISAAVAGLAGLLAVAAADEQLLPTHASRDVGEHVFEKGASVALVVDVSTGKEALPWHAHLWRGVTFAVSNQGATRVTVLLVAGEDVSQAPVGHVHRNHITRR